jgi:hypothetical protein
MQRFRGKSEQKRSLGTPKSKLGVIFKWIIQTSFGKTWNGLIWLRIGEVAFFCERGDEPSVPQNAGNFYIS